MTKSDMLQRFTSGESLTQSETSPEAEITMADELINEGLIKATDWFYIEGMAGRAREVGIR